MKRPYTKVGLYRISKPVRINMDEPGAVLPPREAQRPPNSHVALRQFLAGQKDRAERVIRDFPRTPHAKLAAKILDEVDFIGRLVETVNEQADKYHVIHRAMLFMRRVRDLDHNLALYETVETQRKINIGQRRASVANRKITTRLYRAACKEARTKKELALLLGVSREGLRRWEHRQQRT